MTWMDFNQMQDDLVTVLTAGVTAAKKVKKECDERDYNFGNMPLIDVRLKESHPAITAGQNYYTETTFEVQISAYDLSDYNQAATIRQSLLKTALGAVRANNRWSAEIETSRIGPMVFSAAKDEESGAFMSLVTFEVIADVYTNA